MMVGSCYLSVSLMTSVSWCVFSVLQEEQISPPGGQQEVRLVWGGGGSFLQAGQLTPGCPEHRLQHLAILAGTAAVPGGEAAFRHGAPAEVQEDLGSLETTEARCLELPP